MDTVTQRRPHYSLLALALPVLGLVVPAMGVSAQQYAGDNYVETRPQGEITARVWFDRGDEPVVERGDRMRVYYRASADAYVAIFNIDTNGTVRMLYPRSPEDDSWVRGGRDYRLLFPRSQYWYVDDQPGLGYYFVVASPEPFDLSRLAFSYYDHGWDLSRVGRSVYRDPFVAMDDYVATLVPDWEYVPYALDFATYHVGQERYDYPRFMCYDCHGFRSYSSWNPYHYHCTNFRIVIYDDPWYYPSYRYSGRRVVYSGIPRADIPRVSLPRYEFKERADGEPGPPLVANRASNGSSGARPGLPDTPVRRPAERGAGGDGSQARPEAASPLTGETTRRPGLPSDLGPNRRGGSGGGVEGGGGSADPTSRGPVTGTPTTRTPTPWIPPATRSDGTAETGTRFVPGGSSGEPDTRRPTSDMEREGDRRYVPVIPSRSDGSESRSRPVLERRPSADRGGAGSADSTGPATRPTTRVGPPTRGGAGSEGPSTPRSGGTARPSGETGSPSTPSTRPSVPTRGGGGSATTPSRPSGRVIPRSSGGAGGSAGPAARPIPRSGGTSTSGGRSTPSTQSTPSTRRTPPSRGGNTQPSTRSAPSRGGTTPSTRPVPPTRRGGGGSTATPTRSSGSASSGTPRAPVRVRPRTRSSGGSSSTSSSDPAPSRSTTPVRVPRRGGGGGGEGS